MTYRERVRPARAYSGMTFAMTPHAVDESTAFLPQSPRHRPMNSPVRGHWRAVQEWEESPEIEQVILKLAAEQQVWHNVRQYLIDTGNAHLIPKERKFERWVYP